MEITRPGTQPSAKGPADWFTGSVRIDPLFQPNEHRRAAAMSHIATQEQLNGKVVDWMEQVSEEAYRR